ncbi:MAG TPA: histidine kinase dimerization/phospho-acceptor domain-containing protein, partial [Thermoanaerobaculia bacterium]
MSSPRRRPGRRPGPDRRLLALSVGFGLFVLLDLALFGWLLFRSLSQQEIERVLLEAEREAESLAGELAGRLEGSPDLYTAMAVSQETLDSIDKIPLEREIVSRIEVRDRQGRLVARSQRETEVRLEPDLLDALESPELAIEGRRVQETIQTGPIELPDIQVAIGDMGTLVVGISRQELSRRIADLQAHLVREAAVVAAVSLSLLAVAWALIWVLVRRSQRLEAQAVEAERLAYLGTLASGLAHEIRNPLNALSLNMQMMQEEIAGGQAEGPRAGRLLSITRSEIGRLEHLVTDFLTYARPRPPEREEVAPAALFERVREVLAADLAQQRARVDLRDETDGLRLSGDPAQLAQLLLNLVQNALAAAADAGRVPWVELGATAGDGEVALEVSDNGCGLSEEAREKVFDV